MIRSPLAHVTLFFHLQTAPAAQGLLAWFLRRGARLPRRYQTAPPIRSRDAARPRARPRRRNLRRVSWPPTGLYCPLSVLMQHLATGKILPPSFATKLPTFWRHVNHLTTTSAALLQLRSSNCLLRAYNTCIGYYVTKHTYQYSCSSSLFSLCAEHSLLLAVRLISILRHNTADILGITRARDRRPSRPPAKPPCKYIYTIHIKHTRYVRYLVHKKRRKRRAGTKRGQRKATSKARALPGVFDHRVVLCCAMLKYMHAFFLLRRGDADTRTADWKMWMTAESFTTTCALSSSLRGMRRSLRGGKSGHGTAPRCRSRSG